MTRLIMIEGTKEKILVVSAIGYIIKKDVSMLVAIERIGKIINFKLRSTNASTSIAIVITIISINAKSS